MAPPRLRAPRTTRAGIAGSGARADEPRHEPRDVLRLHRGAAARAEHVEVGRRVAAVGQRGVRPVGAEDDVAELGDLARRRERAARCWTGRCRSRAAAGTRARRPARGGRRRLALGQRGEPMREERRRAAEVGELEADPGIALERAARRRAGRSPAPSRTGTRRATPGGGPAGACTAGASGARRRRRRAGRARRAPDPRPDRRGRCRPRASAASRRRARAGRARLRSPRARRRRRAAGAARGRRSGRARRARRRRSPRSRSARAPAPGRRRRGTRRAGRWRPPPRRSRGAPSSPRGPRAARAAPARRRAPRRRQAAARARGRRCGSSGRA